MSDDLIFLSQRKQISSVALSQLGFIYLRYVSKGKWSESNTEARVFNIRVCESAMETAQHKKHSKIKVYHHHHRHCIHLHHSDKSPSGAKALQLSVCSLAFRRERLLDRTRTNLCQFSLLI